MSPGSGETAPWERAVWGLNALTSGLGVAVVSLYLIVLLHLSRAQWMGFLEVVAGAYAVLLPASWWLHARFVRPIRRYLEDASIAEGEEGPLRAAYAAALDLPRRLFLSSAGWWALGGVVVASGCALRLPELPARSLVTMMLGALSGGVVAATFLAFGVKEALGPVRESLAHRAGRASWREASVRRVPLVWKLFGTLAAAAVIPLGFAIRIAQDRESGRTEAVVTQVQARILDRAFAHEAGSPEALLATLRQRAEGLGAASFVVVLEGSSGRLLAGDPETLTAAERREVARTPASRSHGLGLDSPNLFAARRLPGDSERWVVLGSPASAWAATSTGPRGIFAALMVGAVAVALGIARLVARDLGGATRLLRHEADRLARGDLRPGRELDSEDELGDLGRSFSSMAEALRSTLHQVADAADRVEASAREMEQIGEGVAAVTVDQVRGIQNVTVSMDGIHAQVQGITDSSRWLSASVEESSGSVLELGASGEELSQTASSLSEQVGMVSSAIEQMMANVRLVAESTEALAEAAQETSASMEEMASSMREVDGAAADTGRLSAQVVSLAEIGCEQVRETIGGMEAIREATETAERVIRSLGSRAGQIGAIVDVIDDVADETNLLALNASIIAAQAGEHGRAFAVVADEIKDLAERVLASTQEIAVVVHAVQEETQAAVGAVEQGSASVGAGVDRSAKAGVSLEEIMRAARESGARTEGIATAVRQQTKAAAHVAELMERVRDGVERIREATREQEQGTGAVHRSSTQMRDAARQVHRTTEEQARGTGRLRAGMEAIREAVAQIQAALEEQSAACRDAAERMEHIYARTRRNDEASQRMGQTTRALRGHAEALRESVRRFRL